MAEKRSLFKKSIVWGCDNRLSRQVIHDRGVDLVEFCAAARGGYNDTIPDEVVWNDVYASAVACFRESWQKGYIEALHSEALLRFACIGDPLITLPEDVRYTPIVLLTEYVKQSVKSSQMNPSLLIYCQRVIAIVSGGAWYPNSPKPSYEDFMLFLLSLDFKEGYERFTKSTSSFLLNEVRSVEMWPSTVLNNRFSVSENRQLRFANYLEQLHTASFAKGLPVLERCTELHSRYRLGHTGRELSVPHREVVISLPETLHALVVEHLRDYHEHRKNVSDSNLMDVSLESAITLMIEFLRLVRCEHYTVDVKYRDAVQMLAWRKKLGMKPIDVYMRYRALAEILIGLEMAGSSLEGGDVFTGILETPFFEQWACPSADFCGFDEAMLRFKSFFSMDAKYQAPFLDLVPDKFKPAVSKHSRYM